MFYCNFKCSLFIWLFRFWFQTTETSHGFSSMSYVLPNICFYIFLCLFVVLIFVFFAWTFLSLLTDFPCVLYITKINIHKKMSSFYVLKLHIFKLSNRIRYEMCAKCEDKLCFLRLMSVKVLKRWKNTTVTLDQLSSLCSCTYLNLDQCPPLCSCIYLNISTHTHTVNQSKHTSWINSNWLR